MFTSEGVQITYVEEHDIHVTGIVVARTLDVPHSQLPADLFDDLVDSVRGVVDHCMTVMRNPPETFGGR